MKSSGQKRGAMRGERGQSVAEFALMSPLMIFAIFIAITFGVIGQTALAVSQLAYAAARYASVNPQLSADQVASYATSGAIGSPSITGNNGANTSVVVTAASGFGQPVTVTVSYNLSSNSLVSMMSTLFSGLGMSQSFPTTLSATESVMSE